MEDNYTTDLVPIEHYYYSLPMSWDWFYYLYDSIIPNVDRILSLERVLPRNKNLGKIIMLGTPGTSNTNIRNDNFHKLFCSHDPYTTDEKEFISNLDSNSHTAIWKVHYKDIPDFIESRGYNQNNIFSKELERLQRYYSKQMGMPRYKNFTMDKLIDLTLRIRQLENSFQTCQAFKGINYSNADVDLIKSQRFNSAVLTTAHRNLTNARMMCGDLLRLVGVTKPYNNAYTGKLEQEKPGYLVNGELKGIDWNAVTSYEEMPEAYDVLDNDNGEQTPVIKNGSIESLCLAFSKSTIGDARTKKGLFYSLVELKSEIMKAVEGNKESRNEALVYFQAACQSLKFANCYLGLRFGELV